MNLLAIDKRTKICRTVQKIEARNGSIFAVWCDPLPADKSNEFVYDELETRTESLMPFILIYADETKPT
jgi:hypothetical protein